MSRLGLGIRRDDYSPASRARYTYHQLIDANGQHDYMSTFCQHGLHDDCRRECTCCGAPCICDRCLHTPTLAEPLPRTELDAFDGPASFIEAGQAFADLVDGRVTAERAAEVLSRLARDGLIVSVEYHDQTIGDGGSADFDGMGDVYRTDNR